MNMGKSMNTNIMSMNMSTATNTAMNMVMTTATGMSMVASTGMGKRGNGRSC